MDHLRRCGGKVEHAVLLLLQDVMSIPTMRAHQRQVKENIHKIARLAFFKIIKVMNANEVLRHDDAFTHCLSKVMVTLQSFLEKHGALGLTPGVPYLTSMKTSNMAP